MDIIAYKPPPGTWLGIDTAGDDHSPGNVITPDIAANLRDLGYRWVARYTLPSGLVLSNPQDGGDYQGCYSLSLKEMHWILEGGLAILPVQFGVFGDSAYGLEKGRNAAKAAKLYGWTGIHHFMDVEGGGPASAGPEKCISYMESWATGNNEGGCFTGLYRTGQVPISARQTYRLNGVTAYWAAAGPQPPSPAPRCDCIQQTPPTKVAGIRCDRDYLRQDCFGDGPALVATQDIAISWQAEAVASLLESPYLSV